MCGRMKKRVKETGTTQVEKLLDQVGQGMVTDDTKTVLSGPTITDEIDEGFFDYEEDLKTKWKSGFQPEARPEALRNMAAPEEPVRFDNVSVCNDCRYLFWNKIPVAIQVNDERAPGGVRPLIATIRRCMLAGVRLPSDDPTPGGVFKTQSLDKPKSLEAPIAVDCSHYDPLTDEELEKRARNRAVAKERRKKMGLFVADDDSTSVLEPEIDPKQNEQDLVEAIKLRDSEDDMKAELLNQQEEKWPT